MFFYVIIFFWFIGIKKYNIFDFEIKEVVWSDVIFVIGIYGDMGDWFLFLFVFVCGKFLRKKEEIVGNEDDLYEYYVKIKDVYWIKND